MNNTNILSLAREEYTDKLSDLLTPCLYDGIKAIWISVKEKNTKSGLMTFQQQLALIPKWNTEIVDNEFSRICKIVNPVKLEKLLEAVFLFNVKILSVMNNKELHLSIPTLKVFIHKVYINIARELYINPYIIDDRVQKTTQDVIKCQKNMKNVCNVIGNCISKTIRECIPIEEILDDFLNNNSELENKIENQVDNEFENLNNEFDNKVENLDELEESNEPFESEKQNETEESNNFFNEELKPELDVINGENIDNIETSDLPVNNNETEIHNNYSINEDISNDEENDNSKEIFETINMNQNETKNEKEEENFFN